MAKYIALRASTWAQHLPHFESHTFNNPLKLNVKYSHYFSHVNLLTTLCDPLVVPACQNLLAPLLPPYTEVVQPVNNGTAYSTYFPHVQE